MQTQTTNQKLEIIQHAMYMRGKSKIFWLKLLPAPLVSGYK